MGQLIVLAQHLADRSRPSADTRPAFFFDLASPLSYLAGEQVERLLGDVDWVPVAGSPSQGAGTLAAPLSGGSGRGWAAEAATALDIDAVSEAERLAADLRLPLVWPEATPLAFPRATRASAYAASVGRACAFAVAAGRLAFCGGYDLDDPEILADAAAAAALSPRHVLAAAASEGWDASPEATARGLARRGVDRLPAVRVGMAWRSGPRAVAEAAALLRARDLARPALGSH